MHRTCTPILERSILIYCWLITSIVHIHTGASMLKELTGSCQSSSQVRPWAATCLLHVNQRGYTCSTCIPHRHTCDYSHYMYIRPAIHLKSIACSACISHRHTCNYMYIRPAIRLNYMYINTGIRLN